MKEKKITVFLIFLLIIATYFVIFPATFNRGVSALNERLPISLPQLQGRDFKFGLDLQGGARLLYEADFSDTPTEDRGQRMEGLRDLIERRVDLYGIGDSSVRVQGERLVVEIPGAHDLDEAITVIGETPFLDFREMSEEKIEERELKMEEIEEFFDKSWEEMTQEDFAMLPETEIEEWEIILQPPYQTTELTGRHLQSAGVVFHSITGDPTITLRFTDEGAEIFEEVTGRNVGKLLATFLDGELMQEATVQEKISGGEAQITGNFTLEEAQRIARDLRIGALPVPITLISQQSIGPMLGLISLDAAIRGGLIGFLLVSLFMILLYRLPGVVSVISLFTYILLMLLLFQIIPVNLTLSGIAAFILSIGMAIDANILIFSRMKEERRKGLTLQDALREGYRRAWPSIRDGNFTTLMVAMVLFFITTSFVRGFAITLIIGILVSILTSMIITRALLAVFEESRVENIKRLWL